MIILHITESFGGGVTSAINEYVKHSSQFKHYLFASVRENDRTGEESLGEFEGSYFSKRSLLALFDLKRYIENIEPDVIHIHSSYAGFFCRLLPFIDKNKLVYTPHCFSFQRNSGFLLSKLYFFIEMLLSYRTRYIAGCGKGECYYARKIANNKKVFELTNVTTNFLQQPSATAKPNSRPIIGMVGRTSEQKGVDFFKKVAELCSDHADFIWIGGGDVNVEKSLKDQGVTVTGWSKRSDILEFMSSIDYYFHTAAWEGFPISVLEASQLEIPLILRDIPAFSEEGLYTISTEEQAAKIIRKLSGKDSIINRTLLDNTDKVNSVHSSSALSEQLNQLYLSF